MSARGTPAPLAVGRNGLAGLHPNEPHQLELTLRPVGLAALIQLLAWISGTRFQPPMMWPFRSGWSSRTPLSRWQTCEGGQAASGTGSVSQHSRLSIARRLVGSAPGAGSAACGRSAGQTGDMPGSHPELDTAQHSTPPPAHLDIALAGGRLPRGGATNHSVMPLQVEQRVVGHPVNAHAVVGLSKLHSCGRHRVGGRAFVRGGCVSVLNGRANMTAARHGGAPGPLPFYTSLQARRQRALPVSKPSIVRPAPSPSILLSCASLASIGVPSVMRYTAALLRPAGRE